MEVVFIEDRASGSGLYFLPGFSPDNRLLANVEARRVFGKRPHAPQLVHNHRHDSAITAEETNQPFAQLVR